MASKATPSPTRHASPRPNYLRVGLDLSTDFEGRGSFNLKLSHNRHWLTPSGTEWRNRVQIGATPSLFSEIYHP